MSIIGHSQSRRCHVRVREGGKERQETQEEGEKLEEGGARRRGAVSYPLVKSKCILFTGNVEAECGVDPVACFNVGENPEGRERAAG